MPYKNKADQKKYHAEWYKKNSTRIKSKSQESNRRLRKRNRDYVIQAKSVSCADCKQNFPYYVMDFDHLEDKSFNISTLDRGSYSLKKIKEEIAKCEVVCSNCHRIRTHNRSI